MVGLRERPGTAPASTTPRAARIERRRRSSDIDEDSRREVLRRRHHQQTSNGADDHDTDEEDKKETPVVTRRSRGVFRRSSEFDKRLNDVKENENENGEVEVDVGGRSASVSSRTTVSSTVSTGRGVTIHVKRVAVPASATATHQHNGGGDALNLNGDDEEEEEDDPDHVPEEGQELTESDGSESDQSDRSYVGRDSYNSSRDFVRRSNRPRRLVGGSYNERRLRDASESWIMGGGGVAKGYRRTRRSVRILDEVEMETEASRTDPEIDDNEYHNEEDEQGEEDMYSRVKRRRTSISMSDEGATKGKGAVKKKAKDEEPVARRLRDRTQLSIRQSYAEFLNNTTTAREDKFLRGRRSKHSKGRQERRRRRHSSDSSSSSSSSDGDNEGGRKVVSPGKKNKHQRFGDIFGKMSKEKKKLMEVQPVTVDPSVTFKSIGGLDSFINKLREVVLFPLLYKEFYTRNGGQAPRGVMLHGPPGTGKTLMARALANECANINGAKVSFFLRKGADLLNKFVGESERQLRALFQQAELHQPSIIFFDEIDGLAPVRAAKSDQIHNSIVSSLLAEIDGLQDRGQVIVMGSTNRLDFVDPALRRPGRFDLELPIFLPTRDGRREILNVHVSKWEDVVAPAVLETLADRTIGFSGADLKFLCWNASMSSLRRTYPQIYTSSQKFVLDYKSIKVTQEDWEESLKLVTPSAQRSLFSNYVASEPLPLFIQPLLQSGVDLAHAHIRAKYPPRSLIAHNVKRLLLTTSGEDSGLNSYVIPALLHMLEPLPAFSLSYEALHVDGVSPEFSVTQKCAEIVRQSSPCICFIEDLDRLSKLLPSSAKQVMSKMLKKGLKRPILFIATIEGYSHDAEEDEEEDEVLLPQFLKYRLALTPKSVDEVRSFLAPVFEQASHIKRVEEPPRVLEELQLAPQEEHGPPRPRFTPEQLRAIEKREKRMQRELRIFLREILCRIVRNKKFEEFTKPVDTAEVPDYLDVIESPMDFEKMMIKLDAGEYKSVQLFMEDIILIRENCLAYNPISTESDKRLRMRASELVDYVEKIFDRELDSDFEEECQEMVKAMKEREEAPNPAARATPQRPGPAPKPPTPSASAGNNVEKKKRRRKSAWANGNVPKKGGRRSSREAIQEEEEDDEEMEQDEEDEEVEEEEGSESDTNSPAPKRTKSHEEVRHEDKFLSLLNSMLALLKKYPQSVLELMEIRVELLNLVNKHEINPDKTELTSEIGHYLKHFEREKRTGGKTAVENGTSSPSGNRRS